ncbi:hypothetical protein BGZ82_000189 [Podila clonocystis]|nr:hypothetical protein BGZ82_000189 [Podila clonocystis]
MCTFFFSAAAVAALALTAQAYPAIPFPGTYPQANNCLDSSVVTDFHFTRLDLGPVALCPGHEQTLRIAGVYGGLGLKDKLVISSQRKYLRTLVVGYQEVDVCQNGKCPTVALDGSFDFTIKFPLVADRWARGNTFTLTYSLCNVEGPQLWQFTTLSDANVASGCPATTSVRPTKTYIPIPILTLS